jgi:hypothetical protein
MARYKVYLCGEPGPLCIPNETCVLADGHTPEPAGYLAWHDWAYQMDRTHVQRSCPACGLLVVWIPKRPDGG